MADLVTTAEAARRLGLSRERVRQLAQRADFPRPLGKVGNAVVWRWTDIEEWRRHRRRLRPFAH
ncbi:MAG: helix-turn-helix domain-containing protein [Actinobacteria bacterium]|nr:helix-turn-helix domain-containing protein [Actinomycetota bacterium]